MLISIVDYIYRSLEILQSTRDVIALNNTADLFYFQDDLHIVIRKQLSNNNPK